VTTAICVLRSGGRYSPAWAARLAAGLRAHVPGVGRVLCLTDHEGPIAGCETVALRHGWPGWWSKFEAFRADLCDGPRLLLDLDTVLVGPAPALTQAEGLVALEDQTFADRVSTALMRFDDGLAELHDRFAADPAHWMDRASCPDAPNRIHGDQVVVDRFLREAEIALAFWQRRHPRLVQIRWSEEQPVEAPVQVFVHRCKPDAIGGPVAAAWRAPQRNGYIQAR
jgi:hypothetical protein